MAKICDITGRVGRMGYNVSHAHNRTKRRFDVNIQQASFFTDAGERIRLKVTPRAIRSVEKKGGIEQFVLSAKEKNLPLKLRILRQELLSKQS